MPSRARVSGPASDEETDGEIEPQIPTDLHTDLICEIRVTLWLIL